MDGNSRTDLDGLFWFYAVSEKQILKTRQSRYSFLVSYPVIVKLISGSLLLLVLSLYELNSVIVLALWHFGFYKSNRIYIYSEDE